jgi:hypothetical protein
MPKLKRLLLDALLFLLASPIFLLQALRCGRKQVRFFALASRQSLFCECGEEISLVGLWKCPCGFTYRGHLVTVCPVCEALPKVVRWYVCCVTTRLPDPW